MLFDWLVVGQVIPTNPAPSVRGPKLSVKKGKTPSSRPRRRGSFLDSIDVTNVVGLRDRAIIAAMVYSFARRRHLGDEGRGLLRPGPQGLAPAPREGRQAHEMPAHHYLEA